MDFQNFMNPNAAPAQADPAVAAQQTPAPATPAPTSVADLYSQVLGRAPDEGGLAYWQQQFGDTIDPNEMATFKTAAAPELAMTGYQPPAPAPYADVVSNWAAANPTATPSQITQAIQSAGGLTPELAAAVAKQYGTTTDVVNQQYQTNQGINSLYQTYLGRAPESQDVVNQWAQQFGSTIDPEEIAAFRQAAAPELAQTHYLSTPMRGDIQQYVAGVLADKTLTPWEQTNKIMEQAQKAGITQSQLEDVYGKQNVQPYMDTYKQGISGFLADTLAKEPGTTMNEVGAIHQAAQKYGLTPDEIAKYGGLDPQQVQSYFDMYDKGLGTIVSQLNDPKTDDITKTQTALALQQKFGTTDAELAKASKGKYTEADIKAYLDPVRNVPTNLQKLFDDPNASAADIAKFVTEAKADPRAAGIYGAALDKISANTPGLYLRDVINANDSGASAQKFLAAAKATPEMATQYAPQIKAVEQALNVTSRARDKDWGGNVPDFAMQMFLGLDKGTLAKAPTQLEFSKPEVKTGTDPETFEKYTYTTQPQVTSKGVITETDDDGNITGYRVPVDAKAFGNVDPKINVASANKPLYATYDANGKRTGFDSQDSVYTSDKTYYRASFDANGAPKPVAGRSSSGGFFGGLINDLASMGPVGSLALMAATGGLGGLAAEALGGGLLANAAGSGLASGLLTDLAGGDFGKGFAGGAAGNLAGNYVGANLPTGMTGSPIVDNYLAKALPNLAGAEANALVTGKPLGDVGIASLLNTGMNMGTNALIDQAMPNTLSPTQQQWASGIGSGLLKSAITGQPIDVSKSIQNTAMQQALQLGRKG